MSRGLSLDGTVAVVTGASSGIGAVTAVALAERGVRVACVARRADRLEATVEQCRTVGGQAVAVAADVADPSGAARVLTAARRDLGPVDIVVNNAGISLHKHAADTTVEEIERVFAVNYFGAVRLTMGALPGMLERRRGAVVNITSVAGYLPNPREAAYGAAKAALSLWSHGLSVDLHGTGVTVGVVSPGPIETEIWELDGIVYPGKLYPPRVVADAVVACIEKGKVHVTAPRKFGITPALYPVIGAPVRWGLRRYGARTAAASHS